MLKWRDSHDPQLPPQGSALPAVCCLSSQLWTQPQLNWRWRKHVNCFNAGLEISVMASALFHPNTVQYPLSQPFYNKSSFYCCLWNRNTRNLALRRENAGETGENDATVDSGRRKRRKTKTLILLFFLLWKTRVVFIVFRTVNYNHRVLGQKQHTPALMMDDAARLTPPEDITAFHHPYTPYPIQADFMRALYACIEQRRIGFFSSPTGTVCPPLFHPCWSSREKAWVFYAVH